MLASGVHSHRHTENKGEKDHSLPKWVKGSLKLQVKLNLSLQFGKLRHSGSMGQDRALD